ncbi:MAG: PA0069 family radical SAM protein [Bacteroidetes bacterium]|nr:PA0069 family radical SAM protein [Bacteroidota bacterium]
MDDKNLNNGDKKKMRGAGFNTHNPFAKQRLVQDFPEGLDEMPELEKRLSHIHMEYPKTVVNKVDSPDVGMEFSLNPYQGCEHGCVYCYARNSHTYWGYSAGLDFEQQIMAKPDAPKRLREYLSRKNYVPKAISLSGNTDCYQPIERKLKITRQLLEVFLEFRHPVGIITKNSLVLRDLDLLKPLAELGLTGVFVSITSMDEALRKSMEPRTSTTKNRLQTIRVLTENGIPAGVMNAPIIPGLNMHEIPNILEAAAEAGALSAGYTMVRLNGQIGEIFSEWLEQEHPLKKNKILNQISQVHQGKLNDSRFGTRMKGDGPVAEIAKQLFTQSRDRFFEGRKWPEFNYSHFRNPELTQIKLF